MSECLEVRNVTTLQNTAFTIEALADRFAQFVDVSALTLKSYRSGVKKFLAFVNSQGISQPTRETALEYKRALSEKYAPATTALYLSSLRRFFSWCESEGLYPNIVSGIKSPKLSHEHKRDAFGGEELKGIIAGMSRESLEDKRNYAMFVLIASCGLRTIEVARASVSDIHRVAGVTVLNVMGKGHTSADAFVKLTPHVERALREYLIARGHVEEDAPLFASCSRRNYGQRLTTRTISGVCKTAMRQAGYDSKRLTAHSLRHSAITLALLSGMSLQETQAFARHSSMNTTLIYAHNVSRMNSQCEAAVSAVLFGEKDR